MFKIYAPAKINWLLYVLSKRSDGFHELLSIMQCISLYDILEFDISEKIEVYSDIDISTEDNLVYKAAALLKEKVNAKSGVKINLEKHIPVQAGLGGGSSDAASTLIGLNKFWDCGVSDDELLEISSDLGSDIPFFLKGNFAIIEGKGEKVTPHRAKIPCHLIVIKPPFQISTRWAYGRISDYGLRIMDTNDREEKYNNVEKMINALNYMDFEKIKTFMWNDIEEVIKNDFPLIQEIEVMLLKEGAESAIMSGSGSAVFGVFNVKEMADRAFNSLKHVFPNYWIKRVGTLI